eukprot:gene17616-biopygen6843
MDLAKARYLGLPPRRASTMAWLVGTADFGQRSNDALVSPRRAASAASWRKRRTRGNPKLTQFPNSGTSLTRNRGGRCTILWWGGVRRRRRRNEITVPSGLPFCIYSRTPPDGFPADHRTT